ncbi:carotenoid oxygenase family protein [Actinomadura sp.]|uniref:carotenoid oxygenase family protein n=1 Tax=Actinomadura sp. TaxID=1989 RepID=UPI0037C682D0
MDRAGPPDRPGGARRRDRRRPPRPPRPPPRPPLTAPAGGAAQRPKGGIRPPHRRLLPVPLRGRSGPCARPAEVRPRPGSRAHGGAWIPGEAVFVPRTADGDGDGDGDGDEDGGWLLTIVAHARGGPSRLVVLDARGLSVTAQVHLPRRVPLGFHGAWIPDHHLVKKGSRGMNL